MIVQGGRVVGGIGAAGVTWELNINASRMLKDAALRVYAAPSYLKRHAEPYKLADLAKHTAVQFELPNPGRPLPWLFEVAGEDLEHTSQAGVRFSVDVLACVSHVRAGGCLFQIYEFVVADDIRRGRLVEVLKPFRGRSRPFSILHPQIRYFSPKVRAFVDHLIAALQGSCSRSEHANKAPCTRRVMSKGGENLAFDNDKALGASLRRSARREQNESRDAGSHRHTRFKVQYEVRRARRQRWPLRPGTGALDGRGPRRRVRPIRCTS